jgi:hypothetical protein
MSLTGRRTCVSASALSLDAQPAQVERVVRRISRPVCGMGIDLLNQNNRQSCCLPVILHYLQISTDRYGVVTGSVGATAGASGEVGNGRMN